MLTRTSDLWNFKVWAIDETIGRVHDLQVDDRYWVVRDIAVDVGHWLRGRLALIHPAVVVTLDRGQQALHVTLTAEQIAEAPGIETHPSVALQHRVEPYEYLGFPLLVNGLEPWSPAFSIAHIAGQASAGFGQVDPHLRSLRELSHYGIEASDGEAGEVEEWLVCADNWRVSYAVIKTIGAWTRKHVLIPVEFLGPISWSARIIHADLPCSAIVHAPDYESTRLSDSGYEMRLRGWYGRPACRCDAAGR